MKLKFLILLPVVFTMFSCTKENDSGNSQLELSNDDDFLEFIKQSSNSATTVEFTTLDKLNESYIKAGLTPISLKDLGATLDEYINAQNNIERKEIKAHSRCSIWSHNIIMSAGDINGNGNFTTADLRKARKMLLGVIPHEHYPAQWFGYVSYFTKGTGLSSFSTYDLICGERYLLGFDDYVPCN